jgi:capsid protein
MKQIGMALEIPFEVLVGHFAASYSASRAAMLEFFETVTIYRNDFVDSFCQPIYNEFLIEAVSKGRISAPGFLTDPNVQLAYSGAYWIGSGLKQLDEIKETTAAALRVEKGFSTISQEASTLTGQDYRDIIRQRAEEKRIAKENNMENEYNFAYHGNAPMPQDRWANRGNNE